MLCPPPPFHAIPRNRFARIFAFGENKFQSFLAEQVSAKNTLTRSLVASRRLSGVPIESKKCLGIFETMEHVSAKNTLTRADARETAP